MNADVESQKKSAALEALKLVKDGMVLGLGTGSTVRYFLEGLSILVTKGYNITGIPTSKETARLARNLGISVDENSMGRIDLDVDGADEIDSSGNLIKGGGGALLREKIVAFNSRKVCIIANESKFKTEGLGSFGVPVEVFHFLDRSTKHNLEKIGGKCKLRNNGEFVTDNGNLILDCDFGPIKDPLNLEREIKKIPGVAEVGIFTSITDTVVLGTAEGVKTIKIK